ncbi:MAG: UDP-N-acetylmuramate:L-alanyl-gamma-D-glutamyl-meso-diaminopimelate ligase [Desulfobacterales bacterium]|nr:UDP-N-acetylmuramate:L-alanyl-gamma-D-glutamyl-meso-diaminopimelate ligase [Desulfobacterales bacterium]
MTSDPNHHIPENVHSVHLIAVCGTAMGALAAMLQEMGLSVTGSDRNVYPPMSTFLAARRIRVMDGFSADHLRHRPDLVVVGNAVTRDNPEAEAMRAMGLAYCSLPEALNHFAAAGKETLLVGGTHGKTTTSSLLAWLLYSADQDPSFMIGGILNNFDGNYRIGAGRGFVVEGDEYDTAYFDKGPKFLHFRPRVAIVTGVEFDHADIFRDLDHVKAAFGSFLARLTPDSLLLAYDADPNLADLLATPPPCRLAYYGREAGSDWRLAKVRVADGATVFEVVHQGRPFGTFHTPMIGMHNLLNAVAALAAAHHMEIGVEDLARGLAGFKGIKRRQEVRGVKNGVTVIDDFAHHPTAVRETVKAVREFYGRRRLVAVFEPRTNTSMRDVFQATYAACFDPADLVCIRKPPLLKKIPEGQRFSSRRLVADIEKRGTPAHYFEDTDAIIDFIVTEAAPEDVVLIMSNGGFDNIHARLLEAL